MPDFLVTVVIPTLAADSRLLGCVQSLLRQTRHDLEVVIVDSSGQGLVRKNGTGAGARVIENTANAGFGAAVNQGIRASTSPYVATLNDDAVAHTDWLESLLAALEARPDAVCALPRCASSASRAWTPLGCWWRAMAAAKRREFSKLHDLS